MINNNFKNITVNQMTASSSSPISDLVINRAGETTSGSSGSLSPYYIYDNWKTSYNADYANVVASENSATKAALFGFGTSDADESADDITVADFADNSNFKLEFGSKSALTVGRHYATFSQTFSYNGASPTTIKEIGLFYKTSTTAGAKLVMFAREVLDQPITVSNGDTFSVSMIIG